MLNPHQATPRHHFFLKHIGSVKTSESIGNGSQIHRRYITDFITSLIRRGYVRVHKLDRRIAKCQWYAQDCTRPMRLSLPQRLLTEFCAMFRDRRWFMATKCWDNFARCRDAFAKHSDCSHASLIILANHESGGGGCQVRWQHQPVVLVVFFEYKVKQKARDTMLLCENKMQLLLIWNVSSSSGFSGLCGRQNRITLTTLK